MRKLTSENANFDKMNFFIKILKLILEDKNSFVRSSSKPILNEEKINKISYDAKEIYRVVKDYCDQHLWNYRF